MQVTVPYLTVLDVASPEELRALEDRVTLLEAGGGATLLGALDTRISSLENAVSALGPTLSAIHGNQVSAELETTLPLTTGTPYTFKAIYRQKVENILAGDRFLVMGDFQVTSEHTYNVMIGSYIRVMPNATEAWSGIEVAEANGKNFNRDEHHFTVRRFGIWEADQNYAEKYFVLGAYAASSAADPGDTIEVHQAYGRFMVLHFR